MPIIEGARPCRGVVVWGRKGGGSTAHGRRRIGRGVVVVRVWLRLEWRLCTLVDQARGSEEWSALSLPRETPALPCDDH